MLDQIKLQPTHIDLSNPQSPNNQSTQKTKDQNKTKKNFKIKKNKIYNTKRNTHQQIFTDPIYAGLQNEENLNENKHNFGPWVHQDRKHFNNLEIHNIKHQTPDPIPQQNFIRPISINEQYFQSQVLTPANLQDDQMNHLPQIKTKRESHQLRFSSFALQLPKHSSFSLLKIQKNKLPISRKKSQSVMPINLLRYESMKYLESTQNNLDLQPHSKPNNVIFNYCCFSSSENNLFGSDLQQMSAKYLLNRKGYLSKDMKDLQLTKQNGFKVKQNEKMNQNKLAQNILSSFKKTISQQLFSELIRKKNRRK